MVEKIDKKSLILKGSMKVFSDKGYHKAKMEDIAKEAGVGKGTIYEYFDSKKALFQEMIKYGIDNYMEFLEELSSKEMSTKEKILSYCRYHGKLISDHVDMAQTLAGQSDIFSKEMKVWMLKSKEEMYKLIEGIIKVGVSRGELREDINQELAVLNIVGTTNQYYTKKIFFDRVKYDDIEHNLVLDIIFKGIGI